jgi:hypothetical protein
MAEAQKDGARDSLPTNAISADLGAILEAQKNAILSAVNSQIHNLQSNLLSAQADLSTQIVSEIQPDTYAFKKKGNEQQFNFNRKVIQKSRSALKALEGPNIAKAKEELSEGISLLNNRQKIIKLADKSEFGWATVQEYIDDELVDDEADASKIKKAEKRAAARIKSLQEKKRKTVAKSSTSTISQFTNNRYSDAFGLLNQISHIFVPKVGIRHTPLIPLSHLICAIDAVNEDIGPIIVPSETNQPDLNLIDIAECGEIDQGVYCSAFIYGKLRSCLSFWRDTICASDFVFRHYYKWI